MPSEAGPSPAGPDRQVEQWLRFALRQQARVAPHPGGAPLVGAATGAAAGCRLVLSHLECLPLFQAEDRAFDVRLGVTLFDEAAGCFFGPTGQSSPVAYDMKRSKGKRGFHVDLDSTFFLRTRTPLSAGAAASSTASGVGGAVGSGASASQSGGVSAVVEVVLIERGDDGIMRAEYSAGCPRFLLLQRSLPPGQCPAPPQLLADGAPCRLRYQFEACPELADTWGPLLPEDFVLSSRELVPGTHRPPGGSAGGTAGAAACAAGAGRHLCDVHAVVLAGLSVRLPEGFLEAVRRQAAALWRHSHGAGIAAGGWQDACRVLPVPELRTQLRLRVSVHNGRRFVGPSVLSPVASVERVEGRRGEHTLVLGKDAGLAWVPADRRVVLVLELLLVQDGLSQAGTPGTGTNGNNSGGGGAGGALAGGAGLPGEAVLGWAAVAPFCWQGSGGRPGEAVVAEGMHQVALRSGPGRWVRDAPVLDWRRLLERANLPSPQAPTVDFTLHAAPGQALWPPPAAARPLRLPLQPAGAGAAGGAVRQAAVTLLGAGGLPKQKLAKEEEQQWRQTVASEVETLQSVQASPRGRPSPLAAHKPGDRGGSTGRAAAGELGGAGKGGIEPQATVQAWQIQAHYDSMGAGPSGPGGTDAAQAGTADEGREAEQAWRRPALPSIRTRPRGQAAVLSPQREVTAEEQAALYAGSPTKRSRGGKDCAGWGSMPAVEAVAEAAATAQPAEGLPSGAGLDLQAELCDVLVTAAGSLQLLGFEAGEAPGPAGTLPDRVHFTFRCFHSAAPTITAPLRLVPALGASQQGGSGSGSRARPGRGRLYALAAQTEAGQASRVSGRSADQLLPCAPELPLPLLDVAELEGVVAELAQRGAPPAAGASLAWQQRLRAVRYLSERRLQVDVWDSDSLLQVGTLFVPLRTLLRQGMPAAEAVLSVPIADPAQGVHRLEAGSSSSGSAGTQLSSGALQGSVLLRLACRGTQLPAGLGGAAGGCAAASWPASPTKRGGRQDGQPVPVQDEVAGGDGGKRDAILRRLQAELPSCVAACVAPGEAVGFEREFVNASSEPGWFTVSTDSAEGGGGAASGDPTAFPLSHSDLLDSADSEVSLVTDPSEWAALEPFASKAGLIVQQRQHPAQPQHAQQQGVPDGGSGSSAGSLRVVSSPRFRLEPHERCLLRFKLSRAQQAEQAGHAQHDQDWLDAGCGGQSSRGGQRSVLSWHSVAIQRSAGSAAPAAAQPSATICVAALQLAAPVVDRTLRMYCPAGVGQDCVAVHAVSLPELPSSAALVGVRTPLSFACSSSDAAARLQRSGTLLLSCVAPPAGASSRFLVALHAGGSAGNSAGVPGSSSPGDSVEAWEVFLHAVPAVRLSASVGGAASARRLLPGLPGGSGSSPAGELCCHWRGAGSGEVRASVGAAATAGHGLGARLSVSFEPASIGQRDTLLSVCKHVHPAGGQGWPRQAELLLLCLDSTCTAVSRTFEVALPAGEAVSKKVRYTSPYRQPRSFTVRAVGAGSGGGSGLAPGLLRIGRPEFELEGGDSAAVKLTFDGGAAAAVAEAAAGGQQQWIELLVVVESAPVEAVGDVDGSRGSRSRAAGEGGTVEEVFRVLVRVEGAPV